MGRIKRSLFRLLAALSLVLLTTCENPILALVKYKVDRAGGDPNIQVSFKGVVVSSGSSADVGPVQVGGTPRTATFTIANTGQVPLTLTGSPLLVLGGVDASSFSPATLPFQTIAAGTNSSFALEFAPTTASPKTATLTLRSDDPDTGTYTITLNGRGVSLPGPDIQVSQGSTIIDLTNAYNFGAIGAGTTKDVIFTISNVGTPGATLTLGTWPNPVSLTGPDFSILSQPTLQNIPDGGSTTFTLRFSAPAGVVLGYLDDAYIASNDADEGPFHIALSGNSVVPDINVKEGINNIPDLTGSYAFPDSIKAGVLNGNGDSATFTIHNTGAWPLAITGITLGGTDPTEFVLSNTTTSPVPVGGSTSFSIRFEPSSLVARTATVTITNDALSPKDSYTFAVTGTASFAPKVYWATRDSGTIRRADLSGSNMAVVLGGLFQPVGLAIDQTTNLMYFSENTAARIGRAALDGSAKITLVTLGGYPPFGVAIDSTYVFWTSYVANRLGRAPIGGGAETFTATPGIAWGIAVDPSTNDLFWTNLSAGAMFGGTKNPLSFGGVILSTGGSPTGLAIDGTTQYWTNLSTGGVYRSDMGQVVGGMNQPHYIALDVADNLMFWTDFPGNVWRANLDGSNISLIAPPQGGSRTYGIALDLVP